MLDKFGAENLVSILDSMVRDPITMQFAEPYFKKFLLEECNDEFKALKISPVFVKLSNTINSSHHLTNLQIEKNQANLYKFLNNKIDFNQDTYTNMPLNYMVSLSGGDVLLALDPNTELEVDDIKEYLESSYSAEYSNDNLLRYVVADEFSKLNKNNFSEVFFKQTDQCNKNKIPLIDNMINDEIIQNLLDISLKDTMSFYSQIIPDTNSITAKAKYMSILGRTVLDVYSTLDVVHDKEIVNEKNVDENLVDEKKVDKKSFVPKFKIDYSKINYSQYSNNQQNQTQNREDNIR